MLNPPTQIDRRGLTPKVNFDGTYATEYPNGGKPEPSEPTGDWVIYSGTGNDGRSPIPTMRLNYPRPDAETDAGEYHRVYHGSLCDVDVLVDVQFGRWPYRYEKIQGPAWLSVGNEMTRSLDSSGRIVHTPGPNYGRVYGSPAGDTASYTVIIRVTDQKGSTEDVTWSIARNDNAFVEINSATGADSNDGITAPIQTFANGLWKNSDADTTFAGKIAVFNGGSYDINAGTLDTNPIMDVSKKPSALVCINGATFNTSRGHFRTASGSNLNGVVFKGVAFDGSRTDLANNRIVFFNHQAFRPVVHDCSIVNVTPGTAPSNSVDNPGWVVMWGLGDGTAAYHQNLSFMNNTIGAGCEVSALITFDSNGVSAQGNTANIPANGDHVFLIKDDSSNVCLRGNFAKVSGNKAIVDMFNQHTKADPIQNQEVSFNTLISTGGAGVSWNTQASASASNMHQHDNTIISDGTAVRFSQSDNGQNVLWSRDVYVGAINLSGYVNGATPSAALTSSDFDSNGILVGSARDSHVVPRSAEIVAEAP